MWLQIFAIVAMVIVVLVVGVLGYAASKPNAFRVERSAIIPAPPDKVFAFLGDFHRWEAWSPWERLDREMKKTYGGPASGKGATYEWEGNRQVGQGRMEIIEATVPTKLKIKLNFIKPFQAEHATEFTLRPSGGATDVTWAMHGQNQFMAKVMGIFMNMDKMIGNDFEKGLANLTTAAQK